MKQLRVLTGAHAGALLPLTPSTYLISADPDADLEITDWNAEPLRLQVPGDNDDMTTATLSLGSDATPIPFVDLQPRRFGDVVLCLGPGDSPWPSDVELIERLWQSLAPPPSTTAADAPAPSPRSRWIWLALTIAAVPLTVGGAIVALRSEPAAEPPPSALSRVREAIGSAGLQSVSARESGRLVVVEGLLADEAEVARLRTALAGLPAGLVQDRYAAATELSQRIAEALAAPGVTVRHLGRGTFVAEGAAVGADRLPAAVGRLVNDLQPLVRDIRLSVVDLPPPSRLPTGAMLRTQRIEYVQTRDGTKYLSLISPPPVPVAPKVAGGPKPTPPQSLSKE